MATESKINEDVVAVPVPQGTLDAVSNGTFYNPHEVLGGHLGSGKHADVVTIRVLRPLAKSVTIITEQGQTLAIHEYNGVFMALVPAAAAEEGYGVPDYRIRTEYEDGSVVVSDDPYRYLPTIGESRVLRDGFVFLRTQNKADRGIVVWAPHKIIEHANIAVHLTNIPMGELSHL